MLVKNPITIKIKIINVHVNFKKQVLGIRILKHNINDFLKKKKTK